MMREPTSPARATIGADRVDLYLGRISGVFGLLWVLQAGQAFVADLPSTPGPLGVAAGSVLGAAVLCGLGATLRPHRARRFLSGAVALYLAATILWLVALRHPIPETPFPFYPAVAVSPIVYLAVAGTRLAVCIAAGFAMSAGLGAGLVLVGGVSPVSALVDALFLAAMSIGLPLVVSLVRRAVRRADTAQAVALATYARAQAEVATGAERRRTDALIHDAVLTTYLAAASARTPEEHHRAARMAANARRVLAHLNRAAEYGPSVSFDRAVTLFGDDLAAVLPAFAVRAEVAEVVLPSQVADVMLQAMLQAMTNSVQHAQAQERELQMTPLGPDGLRITVTDDGIGFDASSAMFAEAPMQRTVIGALRQVDGRADVRTAPGQGCVVVLSWGSIVMSGVAPLPDLPSAVGA